MRMLIAQEIKAGSTIALHCRKEGHAVKICFNFKTLRQLLIRKLVVYARKCCISMNYRQGKNTKWLIEKNNNVGTCILLPFVKYSHMNSPYFPPNYFTFFQLQFWLKLETLLAHKVPTILKNCRVIQVGQVSLMLNLNKIKIIIHWCLYFKCCQETWLHIFVFSFISYQYYK